MTGALAMVWLKKCMNFNQTANIYLIFNKLKLLCCSSTTAMELIKIMWIQAYKAVLWILDNKVAD